ncbi:GDSL esterase/lipase At5g55050-like [Tripterygium wilfordii]|uniref:GDSL esterase/lipase At5g55050-like n=1 Tax=Tripterygium wilfordii TaxID=458696 RepID=UPI0018F83371|nr:GDSL esterase/lipase At5g55050-like [Tripterygium wilfordii]
MAKVLFVLVLSITMLVLHNVKAQVPAIYILGDSTADVGTNNFLLESKFAVNFPPNGVDFPFSIPTGRFSNGLNSADFLAILMGLKISPPPFLSLLSNEKLLRFHSFIGINFASGGSGILDITGKSMTVMKLGKENIPKGVPLRTQRDVVSLEEQVQQFKTVHFIVEAAMGLQEAKKYLSKSLFFISIGSNDIFEYYHSKTSVPKQKFRYGLNVKFLNSFYMQELLKLGARKFGIISVPPIGCCPSQRIFNGTGGCLEELNEHARAFHSSTHSLMSKLSLEYQDMKYSIGNAYEMTVNVIENQFAFGLNNVVSACCGGGKLNGEEICSPTANLCSNRSEYLFWDLYHPTQKASQLAAFTLFGGEKRFVAPINFAELAKA